MLVLFPHVRGWPAEDSIDTRAAERSREEVELQPGAQQLRHVAGEGTAAGLLNLTAAAVILCFFPEHATFLLWSTWT